MEEENNRCLTHDKDIDAIILSFLDDQLLCFFLQTCSYVHSLTYCNALWVKKIDNKLPHFPIISDYMGKEQYLYFILAYLDFNEFDLIEWSAGAGYIELIEWVAGYEDVYPDNKAVTIACRCGRLEIVEWVKERLDLLPSKEDMDIAFTFGHLSIIKWALDTCNSKLFTTACSILTTHSHLEGLKLVYSYYPDLFTPLLYSHIPKDSVSMWQWLYSMGIVPDQYLVNYAALQEDMSVVKWLMSIGFHPDDVTVDTCVSKCRWNVIKVLNINDELVIQDVINKIVEEDNTGMLQWWCANKVDDTPAHAFAFAIEQSNLPLITLLMDTFPVERLFLRSLPCPYKTYKARRLFVEYLAGDDEHIVKYVHHRLGPRPPVQHEDLPRLTNQLVLTNIVEVDCVTLAYLPDDILHPFLLTCKYTQSLSTSPSLSYCKIVTALPDFPIPYKILVTPMKHLYNDMKKLNFAILPLVRWAIRNSFVRVLRWAVEKHGIVLTGNHLDVSLTDGSSKIRAYVIKQMGIAAEERRKI